MLVVALVQLAAAPGVLLARLGAVAIGHFSGGPCRRPDHVLPG